MNNEFNQNTRTLIVSFVFALMVMVPLRFIELSNYQNGDPAVLGESVVFSEAKLEAPYNLLESNGSDCLESSYVDKVISYLTLEKEKESFENRRCK